MCLYFADIITGIVLFLTALIGIALLLIFVHVIEPQKIPVRATLVALLLSTTLCILLPSKSFILTEICEVNNDQ